MFDNFIMFDALSLTSPARPIGFAIAVVSGGKLVRVYERYSLHSSVASGSQNIRLMPAVIRKAIKQPSNDRPDEITATDRNMRHALRSFLQTNLSLPIWIDGITFGKISLLYSALKATSHSSVNASIVRDAAGILDFMTGHQNRFEYSQSKGSVRLPLDRARASALTLVSVTGWLKKKARTNAKAFVSSLFE